MIITANKIHSARVQPTALRPQNRQYSIKGESEGVPDITLFFCTCTN